MTMIKVLSIKRLQQLIEAIESTGHEPVIVCRTYSGETVTRIPFDKTAENYANLATDCDKAWLGVRIW